jgi:hypothetical protein
MLFIIAKKSISWLPAGIPKLEEQQAWQWG